jgi:hypothetical protein
MSFGIYFEFRGLFFLDILGAGGRGKRKIDERAY